VLENHSDESIVFWPINAFDEAFTDEEQVKPTRMKATALATHDPAIRGFGLWVVAVEHREQGTLAVPS
jgi:hypothetical protein